MSPTVSSLTLSLVTLMTHAAAAAPAWPIGRFITSFVPVAARGACLASKLALLASLAFAVALDLERLFILVISVPGMVPLFAVYGLFSAWSYRPTGHPFVAGFANAVAFAWAIGVTSPPLAG